MIALDVITVVLLALGCFVIITSGVGVLRLPDFFTRMHPAGKNDSLAQVLILLALVLQAGLSHASLKLILISLFLFITTPSATHAIARAAVIDGRKPWTQVPIP